MTAFFKDLMAFVSLSAFTVTALIWMDALAHLG